MEEFIAPLTPYIAFVAALIGLVKVIVDNRKPQAINVKQKIIVGKKEFESNQEVSTFEQEKSGIPRKETTK